MNKLNNYVSESEAISIFAHLALALLDAVGDRRPDVALLQSERVPGLQGGDNADRVLGPLEPIVSGKGGDGVDKVAPVLTQPSDRILTGGVSLGSLLQRHLHVL